VAVRWPIRRGAASRSTASACFHNLSYDTDLANARNILNDAEGRIYIIDNSRAFRTRRELITGADLTRFWSELLERLRELDRDRIKSKLGRWLSKRQIEGLMVRRDLILALVERRVAERGADATFFRLTARAMQLK